MAMLRITFTLPREAMRNAIRLPDCSIDTHAGLICTIRFALWQIGFLGDTGYGELHLGTFGAYQMITDENIGIDLRVVGIAAEPTRL